MNTLSFRNNMLMDSVDSSHLLYDILIDMDKHKGIGNTEENTNLFPR